MAKPMLAQLETQGRLTLALLPLVAALPFLSDEMIARLFGQSMLLLNWTRDISSAMPSLLTLPEPQIVQPQPRTKEEKRAYWREAKREERRRKRMIKIRRKISEPQAELDHA